MTNFLDSGHTNFAGCVWSEFKSSTKEVLRLYFLPITATAREILRAMKEAPIDDKSASKRPNLEKKASGSDEPKIGA